MTDRLNTTDASAYDLTSDRWLDPAITRAPYSSPADRLPPALGASPSAAAVARWVNAQPPGWRATFIGMVDHG